MNKSIGRWEDSLKFNKNVGLNKSIGGKFSGKTNKQIGLNKRIGGNFFSIYIVVHKATQKGATLSERIKTAALIYVKDGQFAIMVIDSKHVTRGYLAFLDFLLYWRLEVIMASI